MDTATVIIGEGVTVSRRGGITYVINRWRPEGFETETNDCMVWAVKHAAGVPYSDAHKFCRDVLLRRDREGTRSAPLHRFAFTGSTLYGYRVAGRRTADKGRYTRTVSDSYGRRTRHTRRLFPTLAEILPALKTGRHIVCSGTHAFAVIDGVVYDGFFTGARTRVREIFTLTPSSEAR